MSDSATVTNWLQLLSPRKREIVEAVRAGLGRKEIAARMGISPETVKQYTRDIYERAGVHSGKELLAQLLESHETQWAAEYFASAAPTPPACHQALLAKARSLAPQAAVRLVAIEEMPPPAREAVSQGRCFGGTALGQAFYVPYWAPPEYMAVAIHGVSPVRTDTAQQLHVLAALTQARITWLMAQTRAGAARPAVRLVPLPVLPAGAGQEFGIFGQERREPVERERENIAPEWVGDDGL